MAEAGLLGFASHATYEALHAFFAPDVVGWVIHAMIELTAILALGVAFWTARRQ